MKEVITGFILGIIVTICAYNSGGEKPKEFIRYLETPLPNFKSTYKTYNIKVIIHNTKKEVSSACKRGPLVVGCAYFEGNQCTINTDKDYDTFLHESRHCFEGSWHN